MIKAGIIGGAGYTAGELIRLLLNHPDVEIAFINSSSNAGNKITDVHEGLYGETDLVFTDELPLDTIDVLFFCTAHGDTKKFMESHNVPEDLKIIDLSMDYRIKSDDHDFVYGLPELNRRTICHSKHVANPGCFATCIQLGLLPLAKHLLLNDDVMVNAITGSTGAGVQRCCSQQHPELLQLRHLVITTATGPVKPCSCICCLFFCYLKDSHAFYFESKI
jgi:N-acetyl-gamma-glutamyl-phosphate reductase